VFESIKLVAQLDALLDPVGYDAGGLNTQLSYDVRDANRLSR
jgi:hypothetical protein